MTKKNILKIITIFFFCFLQNPIKHWIIKNVLRHEINIHFIKPHLKIIKLSLIKKKSPDINN